VTSSVRIHLQQQKFKHHFQCQVSFLYGVFEMCHHVIFYPSAVTNCHTFLDPLIPRSMTYFMADPLCTSLKESSRHKMLNSHNV